MGRAGPRAARSRSSSVSAFPTTKLEQWRFTSVAPIAERTFRARERWRRARRRQQYAPLSAPIAHAVCVNGRFAPQLSQLDKLPKGVQILGLEAALASHPALVEPYLAQALADPDERIHVAQHGISARRHRAHRSRGVVLEQPIELTFASVAEGARLGVASAAADRGRRGIAGDACSNATWAQGAAFTNAVGEVWLGPNAVIDHYKLQEEPADAFHIASMFLHCARSGTFSSHSLTFGGGLVRNDVVATLAGEGIDCTLNGLYVGRGKQLIDNHTTIDHAMPHCGSHEVYKGILADQSRAVFNGKIIVRPDAQKTDAKQTNKALLLSDDANINYEAGARDFRQRREVHARRGDRPARRGGDVLPAVARARRCGIARDAGARVRGRHPEPREDRSGSRISRRAS